MRKVLLILLSVLLLTACGKEVTKIDIDSINEINEDNASLFSFPIHSNQYKLICLNDFNVEYKKDSDKIMYPASLTKIVTLDTVLHLCDNLQDTSSINQSQMDRLEFQDASLAFLQVDKEYTIEELLYALILPSGADAALAIETYFYKQDINLNDEMNKLCKQLGCANSNFLNTTGLYSKHHYTTIDDLLLVFIDCLQYEAGREILESLEYKTKDDFIYSSSLNAITNEYVEVLGGKTGFTIEGGELISCIYRKDKRSYLLLLADAQGNSYEGQDYHLDDCLEIFRRLYN